ncbi:sigma 54-interacting transcriptional regulator, partial [Acinetobacter baumannii]|uniref:sigma 54-interacting transcriptional regulator n=1 Tax=Acinetobacter baumannii TaxID=470 RepID=UPI0014876776
NQQISIDCRIIAAAKGDLLDHGQAGTFRSDLYYRLNVVTIYLPPLRERREDIPLRLEYFTLLSASRFGRPQPKISTEQMNRLMAYSWP